MNEVNARREAILVDTIAFYNKDINRRSYSQELSSCMYRSEDGHRCAVGRLITDEEYDPAWEEEPVGRILQKLPRRIQELGKTFLIDLQNLHDVSGYWQCDGLSPEGKLQVDYLRQKYGTPYKLTNA